MLIPPIILLVFTNVLYFNWRMLDINTILNQAVLISCFVSPSKCWLTQGARGYFFVCEEVSKKCEENKKVVNVF